MKVTVFEPVFGCYSGEFEVDDTNYPQEKGKKYLKIHLPHKCLGHYCPFHRPSNHSMKDWSMNVRLDNSALVERVCSHGVGHPDPDSVSYFVSKGITHMGIHNCDGCRNKKK